MSGKEPGPSRRALLAGIGTAGVAALGAGLGTTAYFTDTESVDGFFQAGRLELSVDWNWVAWSGEGTGRVASTVRRNSERETIDGREDLRLEFDGFYPGDWAVLRVTVRVDGTPAYVRSTGEIVADPENSLVDPERESGDAPGVDLGDDPADGTGELDNELQVVVGASRSAGTIEDVAFDGSLREWTVELSDGGLYRGPEGHAEAGPRTRFGPPDAATTDTAAVTQYVRIGLPPTVGNTVQTDGVTFELGWEAEQVQGGSTPATDPGDPPDSTGIG